MNRLALFLLAGIPLLMGQMCDGTGTLPVDNETPSPQTGSDDPPADGPNARTLAGPGFSIVIPAGFTLQAGFELPAPTNFLEAYGNGQDLIVISTETPETGGPFDFDSALIRIKGRQTSDSGDLVLRAGICSTVSEGESLAGYSLLSDGDLLCVQICPVRPLDADAEAFGTSLFRSIVLDNTDGRKLEEKLYANNPKLQGHTDQGLVILNDMTVWVLDAEIGGTEFKEMRSWPVGSAIQTQGPADSMELVAVGRWVPVPVRYMGLAIETTIVDYDMASRRITFADGQSRVLLHSKLPQSWSVGMTVMLVQDQGDGWIIRPLLWQSIRI